MGNRRRRGWALAATLAAGLVVAACDERGVGPPAGTASSRPAAAKEVLDAAPPPLRDLPDGDGAIAPQQAAGLVGADQTKVELVSAGQPPRRQLRYRAEQPARGRLVVTAEIAMTLHHPGEPTVEPAVPPLRVVVDVQVRPAQAAPATVVLAIEQVAATPVNEAQQAVAAEMAPVLATLRGLESTFLLPPRGLHVGPPQLARRTTPEVLQLWTTIGEAVRELVIPYPAGEVGHGAQWRVFDQVARAGVAMLRRTNYRVEALDDQSVTVAGDTREVAIASSGRRDPALPAERLIAVLRGDSTGSRAVRRPLDRFFPQDSESKLLGKLVLDTRPPPEIAPDGAVRRTTMQLRQTLRVVPEGHSAGPVAP